MSEVITSASLKKALRDQYSNDRYVGRERYALFEELRTGTGYGVDSQQHIDAWLLRLWPQDHYARVAFEIKISRSDFLREMKQPLKRRMALLLSNQFYFLAPVGLIKAQELPIEAGLLEWSPDSEWLSEKVSAPWRDTPPPPWSFFASFARRLYRQGANTAEAQS